MLSDFLTAMKSHGIPSRVCADKGGEFVHIEKLMNAINGQNHNSFISGKSVHNIRIDRLWRDVFTKVIEKYCNLFIMMEERNVLDIENLIHLPCLHHVFGKRIQNRLNFWKWAHKDHMIRSERNKTPSQLWYNNASLLRSDRNITAMNNLISVEIQVITKTYLKDFVIFIPFLNLILFIAMCWISNLLGLQHFKPWANILC